MATIPNKLYIDKAFTSETDVNKGIASIPQKDRIDIDAYINQQITAGIIIAGGSGTFVQLSGPVTSGVNGGATSITDAAVTNAKLANVGTATIKGRVAGGSGVPTDLTGTQATTLLDTFTVSLKGLVSPPGSVTGKVLSDDGTWITVAAGGTIDANPTNGSSNAVSSGGTFTQLATKVNLSLYNTKGDLLSGSASAGVPAATGLGSNGQVLTADSTTASGIKWATPSSGSGSTKYAVTVSGSAGILARVYGTAGITVTKTNASTITFAVPSGGYIENYQIFYPTAENPGSNATHVFNYTSNTVTNQGNSTADAPNMIGWFASGLPTDIYHARGAGSAVDFVNSITAVGSGNITILTNFGTTGLSSGDIILKGNF